jgi:anti-sigma factor RsiW
LLTCKEFLQELSDYLDENVDPVVKSKLEQHIAECPNCWVICDTTKRTIRIYRGMDAYPIPGEVEARLMAALDRKIAAKTK